MQTDVPHTYTGQREPHLVHLDLVYEGEAHAVGEDHEGGDDVHDSPLGDVTERQKLYVFFFKKII